MPVRAASFRILPPLFGRGAPVERRAAAASTAGVSRECSQAETRASAAQAYHTRRKALLGSAPPARARSAGRLAPRLPSASPPSSSRLYQAMASVRFSGLVVAASSACSSA
jgi:hypothetical protein